MLLDELRQRLYLANSTANRVDILDLNTRRIVKSIPTGTYPLSLALSVDSNSLFVTNTQSASITVIDLGSDTARQTVSLPARPEGIAVGTDGRVLITTQGSGTNNTTNTHTHTHTHTQNLALLGRVWYVEQHRGTARHVQQPLRIVEPLQCDERNAPYLVNCGVGCLVVVLVCHDVFFFF